MKKGLTDHIVFLSRRLMWIHLTAFYLIVSGGPVFGLDIGPGSSFHNRPFIRISDHKLPNTTEKFDSLYEASWKLMGNDLDAFKAIGVHIWEVSLEENYLPGKCQAPQIIGTYYYFTGALDSALYYYEQALKYREQVGNNSLIGSTINNIANVFLEKGEYFQALDYYKLALEKKHPLDSLEIAQTVMNIGSVYYLMSDYEKALLYNNQALKTLQNADTYQLEYANCLSNIGSIYKEMNQPSKALGFFEHSLPIYEKLENELEFGNTKFEMGLLYLREGQLNKSLRFFEEALNIHEKHSYASGIASVYSNLSLIYRIRGNYEQALSLLEESQIRWKQLENLEMLADTYLKEGEIKMLQNKYRDALQSLKEAEALAKYNSEQNHDIYNGLARAYEELGDYKKANPYHVKSLSIKDSINNNRIRFKNLELRYEADQNKIKLLNKEKTVLHERHQREINLRRFLLILLVLSSILGFTIFKARKARARRILAEKESNLKQQELEALLRDRELSSIHNMLEIQDEERKRISKDLHDRLGSTLSMVKLLFQKSTEDKNGKEPTDNSTFDDANALLDEAVAAIRKISHDLSTGVLQNFGLIAAINELRDTLNNSKQFSVELITHNMEENIPKKIEVAIYRIIRELLSNIIRHAYATEICIQLIRKQQVIHVEVSDNGRGFNVMQIENFEGMGFKNIRSRLLPFEGKMNIDSQPGKGTTIFIQIPLNNNYD